jgi:hypothetical protein
VSYWFKQDEIKTSSSRNLAPVEVIQFSASRVFPAMPSLRALSVRPGRL